VTIHDSLRKNFIKVPSSTQTQSRPIAAIITVIYYTQMPSHYLQTNYNPKITASWDIVPCCLVEVDRRFRGASYLHHQSKRPSTSTRLQGVITQTAVIFILTAVKTLNLTRYNPSLWHPSQQVGYSLVHLSRRFNHVHMEL
jgi:hypothetical protein